MGTRLIAVRKIDDFGRIQLPKEARAQAEGSGKFLVYVARLPEGLPTKKKKYGILLVPAEG